MPFLNGFYFAGAGTDDVCGYEAVCLGDQLAGKNGIPLFYNWLCWFSNVLVDREDKLSFGEKFFDRDNLWRGLCVRLDGRLPETFCDSYDTSCLIVISRLQGSGEPHNQGIRRLQRAVISLHKEKPSLMSLGWASL